MRQRSILDAGPLVAFLSDSDEHSKWAVSALVGLPPPFYTCEAVITEASYLARAFAGGGQRVIELVNSGWLQISFVLQDEAAVVQQLMRRYSDVPMSLADACIVRMTEHYDESVVITTDRHFRVYRRNGRSQIPLLTPR